MADSMEDLQIPIEVLRGIEWARLYSYILVVATTVSFVSYVLFCWDH